MSKIEIELPLGQRCPTCNMGWGLFPPAKIHNTNNAFRCVECKDVFTFEPALLDGKEGL